MTKALKSLAALLLLGLNVLPAAGAGEATSSDDGHVTVASPGIARPDAKSSSTGSEHFKVIYSTFSDDKEFPYNPFVAYTLSTRNSDAGRRYTVAMPFTPAEPTNLRKVVVALARVSGLDEVSVSLRADDGGLPGAVIKRVKVGDLPAFGQCCETETIASKAIPLAAGTRYWVLAKANADTHAGWNWNTISLSGPFARKFDSGDWEMANDALAAFSVLGD